MWEQLSLIAHAAGTIEMLVTHLHSLNLHFLAGFFFKSEALKNIKHQINLHDC